MDGAAACFRAAPAAEAQIVRPRDSLSAHRYSTESMAKDADRTASQYLLQMSPTVLRVAGYRLYFFSREEARPHVHVQHVTGEAKFWLEPRIGVATNHGLSPARLATAQRLVREHRNEIRAAWKAHFGR